MTEQELKKVKEEYETKFLNDYKCWNTNNTTSPIAIWDFIEAQLKKQRILGRLFELRILEVHLEQQIYQSTVNTGSIYKYIDTNRDNLLSELNS